MLTALLLAAAVIELKPQPGVPLLGISCGGIHTSTYVTGFTPGGNVAGEVYAWTRCGSAYRYGHATTYKSWHSIEWDLDGVPLGTFPWDGTIPDADFTDTDDAGDVIYTSSRPTGWGIQYYGLLYKPEPVNGYAPKSGGKTTAEPDSIVIDQRPPAWSPFQTDINWNPEQPMPIIPKGWGVVIVMPYVPEPESGCNAAQNRSCGKACGKAGKTLVSCELEVTWNPDGSTTRNLICTCAAAGVQDPRVAGSRVETMEIKVLDRE